VCCCIKETKTVKLDAALASTATLDRETYTVGLFFRDLGGSFHYAFMFHLVVSVIWGVERSLGSPENHAQMGLVWFGGWLVWMGIAVLLRPGGILVGDHFICLTAWDNTEVAQKVLTAWQA